MNAYAHRLPAGTAAAEPINGYTSPSIRPDLRTAANGAVLLTEPHYCGTLAAARALGALGLTVWTTGPSRASITAHSRFVAQHWLQPRHRSLDAQVDWLETFGRHHPGTMLHPTSDDQAWLQALHARRLDPHFRTYLPSIDAMEAVLDKGLLYEACRAVGIDVPVTYFAESDAEVAAIARSARYPLLLKQRTQIFSKTRTKGLLVHSPQQLLEAYPRFVRDNSHAAEVTQRMPFASWPLVQEYHADARDGSYVISGFVNREYTHCAMLAAVKVLQYPRTLGIALCLETAPLDLELADKLLALCKRTGHFGVFQVEFLVSNDRKLLIDFNPRYYHYMGFDIARGLPLPLLSYLGALGENTALERAVGQAGEALTHPIGPEAFTYRLQLHELLWLQRLSGRMSKSDTRRWLDWVRRHRSHLLDAVADPDDRLPEITAAAANLFAHCRHPRSFLRQIVLDRWTQSGT